MTIISSVDGQLFQDTWQWSSANQDWTGSGAVSFEFTVPHECDLRIVGEGGNMGWIYGGLFKYSEIG